MSRTEQRGNAVTYGQNGNNAQIGETVTYNQNVAQQPSGRTPKVEKGGSFSRISSKINDNTPLKVLN